MEFTKKIGIGITMIVPGFVFGAILWTIIESWLAVLGLEIVMILIYAAIISGKPLRSAQKS